MLRTPPMSAARGFTLIELMIGIAIMAIVLAVGMPNFSVWIQNSRLRNAAESILGGLQLARSEAVRRNTPVKMTLGAGSSWSVGCVTVSAACPAKIQSRATGDGSASSIIVTAADATAVIFNGLGGMTSPIPAAGAVFTAFNIDVDPNVLSADESRDLRITVDVGGNVRMCDPHVGTTDARACPS